MSAISQKSISGITSITTPASVDNQFTIHTNNTTEAFKLDHAGNIHIHNHVNTTGISSASNFKTGTSNLHSTGLNIFDLDVDGHTNLDNVSISGISSTGNIYITTGGDGRKLSFAGDGSSHYIKMDHTLNGPIVNGYGGIAFETNGTNERLRIGSAGQIGIAGANYGTSGQALVSQGSGSSVAWQTITGTTINNNANNRVITGSGTAATLEGEANLQFDGTNLGIGGSPDVSLHIKNAAPTIRLTDTDTNRFSQIYAVDGNFRFDADNNNAQSNTNISFRIDNSERLHIDSAGQVLPGADDAQNLGSSTKRWANIYAADMHYSNEGSKNDVDGTWGNYTIQEGESDLFLLNNRNGKKYKFVLQEVS